MLSLLKFLPLVALGKDVSSAYTEETGQGRPWYLSRRFIGSVIALLSGALAIQFGVKLDADTLSKLTDNLTQLITTATTLYGIILGIVGYFKRNKEESK